MTAEVAAATKAAADSEAKPPAKPSSGYYVEPGSYSTKRETPIPSYVRNASRTGVEALADARWLDLDRDENDWELEVIAAQPLDRKLYEFDRVNEGQWFVAIIGHWRKWSDVVTLEPYYLLLSQHNDGARKKREIHAPALRFYSPIGKTAFNYDVNLVYQTGEDDGRDHAGLRRRERTRLPVQARVEAAGQRLLPLRQR